MLHPSTFNLLGSFSPFPVIYNGCHQSLCRRGLSLPGQHSSSVLALHCLSASQEDPPGYRFSRPVSANERQCPISPELLIPDPEAGVSCRSAGTSMEAGSPTSLEHKVPSPLLAEAPK
ncbi:hypothetical protein C0J52_02493 [Blattella germanica]|nr:hypothetical protein C0J52_02493 [Blattella germanica]